jgi:hypothetical protein
LALTSPLEATSAALSMAARTTPPGSTCSAMISPIGE